MKILLWHDLEKVGKRGEIVEVRDGYARNYLFPRRLASKPTPTMYKEFELEKRRQAKLEAKLIADAKLIAEKVEQLTSVSIEVNTNEEGRLYGSVTPTMIAEVLKDQQLKVEPKTIEIAEPIKQVGTYEVTIDLHRDVKPKLKLWVLSSKTPASPGEKSDAPAAPEEKPAEPGA
ncbi:MAG: 50S ribosomal protein L9 [Planctomycetes bacterium]|nr:50S ribosomal protein L9 [Planctomycetota bacterium]